jgi:hypothetical protein
MKKWSFVMKYLKFSIFALAMLALLGLLFSRQLPNDTIKSN